MDHEDERRGAVINTIHLLNTEPLTQFLLFLRARITVGNNNEQIKTSSHYKLTELYDDV